MKRCLTCHASFAAALAGCPDCGEAVKAVDGILVFHPIATPAGEGFRPEYFSNLARLEEGNFWFRARNQLLLWAIEKYAPHFRSMLEIGCGTGYVLSGIAEAFPKAQLSGSELFMEGLRFAAKRLPSATLMQMDARSIPFVDEFDLIGAFDVLEHIEADEEVLAQMYAALKPKGFVLITVPQHGWLWSPTDDYACHVRRYEVADLHRKLAKAGFQLMLSTSFVSALLPAMALSRFWQNRKAKAEGFDPESEYNIAPWLNRLFLKILQAEQIAIRSGIRFPAGGSRLAMARKA